MNPFSLAPVLLPVLFAGLLVFFALGGRLRRRQIAKGAEGPGLGVLDGAVFGLLGLLMAFTFSGAAERFERRRSLIVEEANAIGTAYLRLDLLPPETQAPLREDFRQYLDARLSGYRAIPDLVAAQRWFQRAAVVQDRIWKAAVSACRLEQQRRPETLVLPALNEMIDITTTRAAATRSHPPTIIYVMLIVLSLVCSLLAGYGMTGSAKSSRTNAIAFAAILTATIYLVVDLEFPRLGFIRVDAADQVLVEVREAMR